MLQHLRPATTTYRVLAPRYKSIADIKDFEQRMLAHKELVCSCSQKLVHWYR
jgi:hypothetical protein